MHYHWSIKHASDIVVCDKHACICMWCSAVTTNPQFPNLCVSMILLQRIHLLLFRFFLLRDFDNVWGSMSSGKYRTFTCVNRNLILRLVCQALLPGFLRILHQLYIISCPTIKPIHSHEDGFMAPWALRVVTINPGHAGAMCFCWLHWKGCYHCHSFNGVCRQSLPAHGFARCLRCQHDKGFGREHELHCHVLFFFRHPALFTMLSEDLKNPVVMRV